MEQFGGSSGSRATTKKTVTLGTSSHKSPIFSNASSQQSSARGGPPQLHHAHFPAGGTTTAASSNTSSARGGGMKMSSNFPPSSSSSHQHHDNNTTNHSHSSTRPALFTATVSRKRAEQDAVLLQNRIQLLRLEEEKAIQKTKETEKKAVDILNLRLRNQKRLDEKNEIETEERKTKEYQKSLVQKRKEENVKNNSKAVGQDLQRKKQDYLRSVEERKRAELVRKQDAEQYRLEAEETRQRVRRERLMSQTRQQQALDAKKGIGAKIFQEKLERELEMKKQKEDLIRAMEREELSLIKKLQETQQRQQAAYEVLEDIVSQPQSRMSSSRSDFKTDRGGSGDHGGGSSTGVNVKPQHSGLTSKPGGESYTRSSSKGVVEQEILDKLSKIRSQSSSHSIAEESGFEAATPMMQLGGAATDNYNLLSGQTPNFSDAGDYYNSYTPPSGNINLLDPGAGNAAAAAETRKTPADLHAARKLELPLPKHPEIVTNPTTSVNDSEASSSQNINSAILGQDQSVTDVQLEEGTRNNKIKSRFDETFSDNDVADADDVGHGQLFGLEEGEQEKMTYLTSDGQRIQIDTGPELLDTGLEGLEEDLQLAMDLNHK
ncbi:unnamed protein product [Amoebophrya sp. A120]|nr:unnamed protein product [Amoebophrya sp. A120]|eukprot:GSA120T00014697001.1